MQIKLPPLRERKSDIPFLVNHFLEKFGASDRNIRTISEDAMGRLLAYDWPGNVRELENVIERALALGSGPILQVADLPTSLHYGNGERISQTDEIVSLEELERRAIFRALREAGGDKLAAARLLGIGKTTLYRKLKEYEAKSTKPERSFLLNSLSLTPADICFRIPRQKRVSFKAGRPPTSLRPSDCQVTESKPHRRATFWPGSCNANRRANDCFHSTTALESHSAPRIEYAIAIGTALLCSYWIVQGRW